MSHIADGYYTINRKMLLCIGIWPYQNFGLRCILVTFTTLMLMCSVIFQFTTFVTKEYSMELLLKILAYSIASLSYLLRYNVLCLNMKKAILEMNLTTRCLRLDIPLPETNSYCLNAYLLPLKHHRAYRRESISVNGSVEREQSRRNMRGLIERVRFDWNELKNMHELEIIKRYSALGRLITLVTILSLYLFIFSFMVVQVLANVILDFKTAANETRFRQLPAETELFIDQQKYYTPILFLMFFNILAGLTTVIAIETLFMSYTQHACGLFEVASYHIEQTFHDGMARDIISVTEKNSIICQGIVNAVDIHRKAIEFIEMSRTNFKWVYIISLPITVISLSLNLYRLSRLITTKDHQDTITTILFVIGHFWYLFFCNYLGQEVIDNSSNMFHKTYNVQWYIAPLKVQKLLLFIMQRSLRNCTIMIGGLFIPSLEGFATLTSMSLSYFMVIYSVQ